MPAAENAPAATALSEYERKRERAAIDVANNRVSRDRAERVLRAWLAMVLLTGADHGDGLRAMDRYADPALGFTAPQQRALAASWLCPDQGWRDELQRAVSDALARTETGKPDARAIQRARALLGLAAALGHHGPFTALRPAAPTSERKAA